MTELILFCFVGSCAMVGLHLASLPGAVLDFLQMPFIRAQVDIDHGDNMDMLNGKVSDRKFLRFLAFIGNPLIMCPKCMASIWGSVWYLVAYETYVVQEWIVVVLAMSFINAILAGIYHRL